MFKVEVRPDGAEPFEVEVTTRDSLKWERARKGRSINQFSEAPTMDALYSLTYVAVQRDGRFSGDIREFEESCDLERRDDTEDSDEADPTQPAR